MTSTISLITNLGTSVVADSLQPISGSEWKANYLSPFALLAFCLPFFILMDVDTYLNLVVGK
jgi:hypothetical protein